MSDESQTKEIRVSSSTPCNSLAGSIVAAYGEGKEITLSAIGPQPVTTAVKAVCVANRTLAPQGVMFCIIPGLITRQIVDARADGEKRPWVITLLHLRNILGPVKLPPPPVTEPAV